MKKNNYLVTLMILGVVLLSGCQSAPKKNEPEAKAESATLIYLVRHGKTWFNTTGQVQGWSDSYLTEDGIALTEQLATSLKDVSFNSAYSSDLGRQRNTAKIILKENTGKVPTITELDGFKETNFGSFEGKTNQELWTPVLTKYELKFDDQFGYMPELNQKLAAAGVSITDALAEGDPLKVAETHQQLVKRGTDALNQVLAENQAGGNVLIVSSGGIIPELLEILAPGQYQGEKIDNCSVTTIEVKDGEAKILKIADTSYQDTD